MAESKKMTPKKTTAKKKAVSVSSAKTKIKKPAKVSKKVVAKKSSKPAAGSSMSKVASKKASTRKKIVKKNQVASSKNYPDQQAVVSPFYSRPEPGKGAKKLNVISRHLMTPRSLITLVQFDKDEVAIQVARYGGVLTIVIGAIFTVYLSSASFSLSSISGNSATAIEGLASTTPEQQVTTEMISFDIAAPSPLREKFPVIVQVATPAFINSILLTVQNVETNQSFTIGFAERKANNTFERVFDSSAVPNGKYRFVAKVSVNGSNIIAKSGSPYDISNYLVEALPSDNPDSETTSTVTSATSSSSTSSGSGTSESHLSETATSSSVSVETTPPSVIEKLPVAEKLLRTGALAANRLSQSSDLFMLHYFGEAQVVEFFARREGSTANLFIGRAYSIESARWDFAWNTKETPVGKYGIFAKVKTTEGDISISPIYINIQRLLPVSPMPLPVAPVIQPTSVSQNVNPQVATTGEPIASLPITQPPKQIVVSKQDIRDELSDVNLKNSVLAKMLSIPPESETTIDRYSDVTDYERSLQPELDRLAAAVRAGDHVAVETIIKRIKEREAEVVSEIHNRSNDSESDVTSSVLRATAARVLQTERSERVVRDRLGDMAVKDSDGDGITDYDETELFGTNPNNPDSDGDGFTDGAELLSGYDPLDSTIEAVVALESPKDFGSTRSDILKVKDLTTLPPDLAIASSPAAIITGSALPNSFVNLFIFSNPVVVTVQADKYGNWSYQFDKEIDDGEHEIYVGMTDNAGRIIAKSNPLKFIKTAEAYTPLQAEAAAVSPTISPDEFSGTRNLLLVSSIAVVAIGLLLLLLGHFLRFTKNDNHTGTAL